MPLLSTMGERQRFTACALPSPHAGQCSRRTGSQSRNSSPQLGGESTCAVCSSALLTARTGVGAGGRGWHGRVVVDEYDVATAGGANEGNPAPEGETAIGWSTNSANNVAAGSATTVPR